MNIVCLDVEGVLVPEIWIAFSEATGIPELRRTTRDEPDYGKLMRFRLGILRERGLGLRRIQEVIAGIDPLPGAREFLDALRAEAQVILLSDTFEQFAAPLMEKLGRPTLFCNTLDVAPDGTIAAGDSHNDLAMIRASKAGFLFRSTPAIEAANPDLPAFSEYADLLAAIRAALRSGSVPPAPSRP